MAAILPSRMPTSPEYHGEPVPSMMCPCTITRSNRVSSSAALLETVGKRSDRQSATWLARSADGIPGRGRNLTCGARLPSGKLGCSSMSPHGRHFFSLWLLLPSGLLGLLASGTTTAQPLTLLQTIAMPEVPSGPYADHMALDVKGQRLFTTPQAQKAVVVLDLKAGKVVHTIRGFVNPHAILYREDRNRLFVTDGSGALVVLDASSYRRIRSIHLEPDADGIGYDP